MYATDDQCSNVGRTQSSDAGVGDESAVVSQAAWNVAGQTPMNKRDNLVAAAQEASAAGEAQVRCGHTVWRLAATFCTD